MLASAAFTVLSLSIMAMGLFAHATHFVALFAVAGVLLIAPRIEDAPLRPGAVYAAGVLLGLAILMKQPGAAFALFAAIWLAFRPGRTRNVSLLAAGGATVGVLTAALLAAAGVVRQFCFWTIDYAREYATVTSAAEASAYLRYNVGRSFEAVSFFPGRRRRCDCHVRRTERASAGFSAASPWLARRRRAGFLLPAALLPGGAPVAPVRRCRRRLTALIAAPSLRFVRALPAIAFTVAVIAARRTHRIYRPTQRPS